MDGPPGLESILGHIANFLEKPRGRSMTATFGLQSAHADGADEIDALLDDVPSAGLNGVDRVIGAKVVKTRRCRLRHMLATVAGILEEHRTGGAETAMALTNFGEEADDIERAAVAGSVAKHRIRERERERWRRLAAFLQDSRTIGRRGIILPVVPCAQRAQPSALTLGASMPCGAPHVPEQGSVEACVRRALASLSATAMLVLQHGGVNPPGRPLSSMVVPRSARHGFGEPHFSG